MKAYISGAIGGHDLTERRRFFQEAENQLKEMDYDVVNPMKVEPCADLSCLNRGPAVGHGLHEYMCYMRHDIKAMMDCDVIVMLPGWINSPGAKIEHGIAVKIHMPVKFLEENGELIDVE